MTVKQTKHYTVDEMTVSHIDNIWTLPALVGNDPNRHSGSLTITIINGVMRSVTDDQYIDCKPAEVIKGWGSLDGPSYKVGKVNVPAAVIDWLTCRLIINPPFHSNA